jgi:hypothetical protein
VGGVVEAAVAIAKSVSSVVPSAPVTRKRKVKLLVPVTCKVVVPVVALAIVGIAPVTFNTLH